MPVEVYIPPDEWVYVSPLLEIAQYMKKNLKKKEEDPRKASKHEVTKLLRPLEDLALERHGKIATISRIMEILERDFGFEEEEERENIASQVKTLVDEVVERKRREPESVFPFLKNLRYTLIGVFRGYVSPLLEEEYER